MNKDQMDQICWKCVLKTTKSTKKSTKSRKIA